jgi:hypothetical protein
MVNQEHSDEHDTSWLGNGLVRYLISDKQGAQQLRQKATFLIIPLADPDGANTSKYTNITHSFEVGNSTLSSRLYVKWFRRWANDDRRIDLVLNLHNVENHESYNHLFNYLIEGKYGRKSKVKPLHFGVVEQLKRYSYRIQKNVGGYGYTNDRLAGFLRRYMGAYHLFYEVNSQARSRKLTLFELRSLGVLIVKSALHYMYTKGSKRLFKNINRRRWKRSKLIKRYHRLLSNIDDFDTIEGKNLDTSLDKEWLLWKLPSYERGRKYRRNRRKLIDNLSVNMREWAKFLYMESGVSERNIPSITSHF